MPTPPLERVALASWPTPLEPAPRLAEAIGLEPDCLWIKRDDLTGLAGGGNKIRKLEWTVGAALAEGADTLVTTGAPQSNHARLTAAAAARVGVDCVLVFPGPPPSDTTGNLVLVGLLGASVVWADEPGDADAHSALDDAAAGVAQRLRSRGRRPAVIPFGGSNATGAHGYRLAAAEIVTQLPRVDHVVTALGSGGTMAGLVAGLGPGRVLGVHTGAVADPHERVGSMVADMGGPVVGGALRIRTDQVGDGYSSLTTEAAHALQLTARQHGLVLDPVYSARAMAGLTAEITDGGIHPRDHVVLLASGGLPGLFGSPAGMALGARSLQADTSP